MKQHSRRPMCRSLAVALIAVLTSTSALAVDSGSTSADGALSPTVNTEIVLPESGILNYTTVNIPAGVTVTFKPNAANTPVYMLASGDVTIASTVSVNGQDAAATGTDGDGNQGDDGVPGLGGPGGFAGGRGGRDDAAKRPAIICGGAGLGLGGGVGGVEGGDGCNATGYFHYIGGGGAYGANAYPVYSAHCNNASYAKAYGSALLQPLVGGSGGGGGLGGTNYPGAGGGGGGGAILIASSGTLKLTGSITAIGGDGGGLAGTGVGSRGAGGSGGAIRLLGTVVTGGGTLSAEGGCVNSEIGRAHV